MRITSYKKGNKYKLKRKNNGSKAGRTTKIGKKQNNVSKNDKTTKMKKYKYNVSKDGRTQILKKKMLVRTVEQQT